MSKANLNEKALTEQQLEQGRQARREYQRAWQKKNRDKVKAAQDRYWARKAAQQQGKAE